MPTSGTSGINLGNSRIHGFIDTIDEILFSQHNLREIIAKLGQAAKLSSPLVPHDLRHTFAKSLLDPVAYGLDRQPLPLPALQQLLGHADIVTTTTYTRASSDDLARMIGTSEAY